MENDWYIYRAFTSVQDLIPGLQERYWTTTFSRTGSFIGSDNPVMLDGPKDVACGFEDAEMVIYSISRHAVLWGTLKFLPPQRVNRNFIAMVNTMSLLRADWQIYTHESDFCWLDETRTYQTDWQLFAKEKF